MTKNINDPIKLEVGVKAFLYRSSGEFLLLKRAFPYHEKKYCKWDIPGGRIKPGEATIRALKREVREETSLTLEKIERILAVQDIFKNKEKHIVRITYLAKCKSGKVKIDPREHSDYRWMRFEDLNQIRKDSYLIPVIKYLQSLRLV
jgi:8-oxo-dGTP diphosphatase